MSKKTKRTKIYVRDRKRCYVCGISLSFDELTLDHLIPKTDGGSGLTANLKTCCETCNKIKGRCENIIDEKTQNGVSTLTDRQVITLCLSYSYFKEVFVNNQNKGQKSC